MSKAQQRYRKWILGTLPLPDPVGTPSREETRQRWDPRRAPPRLRPEARVEAQALVESFYEFQDAAPVSEVPRKVSVDDSFGYDMFVVSYNVRPRIISLL